MSFRLLHTFWVVPLFLVACSSNAQQADRYQGPNDVVATVGNVSITLADVDQKALQQPANDFGTSKLVLAIYEARRAAIDDIAGEKLIDVEAKARGVTTTALIDQEITSKIQSVTDADVTAWFNANSSRVKGATLDQVRVPIRNLLTQERTAAVYQRFVNQLKEKTPVRILLEAPRR